MKARQKNSNDEWKDIADVRLIDNCYLISADQMEFQHDNISTEIKTYNQVDEEKYWENVRIQAAISAMQAIINSDALRNAKIEAAMNVDGSPYEMIALSATLFANSLVKQLKGE